MSVITLPERPQAAGVALCAERSGLSALHRPDCAALLWRRPVAEDVTRWLAALPQDRLPRGRVVIRPAAAAAAVTEMCAAVGESGGAAFAADVADLADAFADVMQAAWVRLRLDVVTTNACRRFHVDALRARLVCTYLGTGTQYGLAAPRNEPAQVHTVATGTPILLRGTQWPAHRAPSLLHRSPPIEGTGEVRLVLVLDPMTGAVDDI